MVRPFQFLEPLFRDDLFTPLETVLVAPLRIGGFRLLRDALLRVLKHEAYLNAGVTFPDREQTRALFGSPKPTLPLKYDVRSFLELVKVRYIPEGFNGLVGYLLPFVSEADAFPAELCSNTVFEG